MTIALKSVYRKDAWRPVKLVSEDGITLVEAMVVLLVASIVVLGGLPNFTPSINSAGIHSAQHEFMRAMTYARTQALTTKKTLMFCGKDPDSDQCNSTDINNWSNGWLIFQDVDNNLFYDSGTDYLFEIKQSFPEYIKFSTSFSPPLIFYPSGITNLSSLTNVTICDKTQQSKKIEAISLYVTGMPFKSDASAADKSDCLYE